MEDRGRKIRIGKFTPEELEGQAVSRPAMAYRGAVNLAIGCTGKFSAKRVSATEMVLSIEYGGESPTDCEHVTERTYGKIEKSDGGYRIA